MYVHFFYNKNLAIHYLIYEKYNCSLATHMPKWFQKLRFSLPYLLNKIFHKNTVECWIKNTAWSFISSNTWRIKMIAWKKYVIWHTHNSEHVSRTLVGE